MNVARGPIAWVMMALMMAVCLGDDRIWPAELPRTPRELRDVLDASSPGTQELVVRALTERIGPRKTLEVIKESLPLTGQTHLHEIGVTVPRLW
jgi:hypothetical protein